MFTHQIIDQTFTKAIRASFSNRQTEAGKVYNMMVPRSWTQHSRAVLFLSQYRTAIAVRYLSALSESNGLSVFRKATRPYVLLIQSPPRTWLEDRPKRGSTYLSALLTGTTSTVAYGDVSLSHHPDPLIFLKPEHLFGRLSAMRKERPLPRKENYAPNAPPGNLLLRARIASSDDGGAKSLPLCWKPHH